MRAVHRWKAYKLCACAWICEIYKILGNWHFFAKKSNSIIITINIYKCATKKHTFLNQVQQFTSHTYYWMKSFSFIFHYIARALLFIVFKKIHASNAKRRRPPRRKTYIKIGSSICVLCMRACKKKVTHIYLYDEPNIRMWWNFTFSECKNWNEKWLKISKKLLLKISFVNTLQYFNN